MLLLQLKTIIYWPDGFITGNNRWAVATLANLRNGKNKRGGEECKRMSLFWPRGHSRAPHIRSAADSAKKGVGMQQLKNSFLLLSMTSCSVGEAKSEMNYTARLESFAHRHTHNFYSVNVTFYIVAHSDTHNLYSGNFISIHHGFFSRQSPHTGQWSRQSKMGKN